LFETRRFMVKVICFFTLLCFLSFSYKINSDFGSEKQELTENEDELKNVMVPIQMQDRVYNKTGVQCVWASIECVGRYAEEPKLIGLTKDKDCQSYASPSSLSAKLKKLNVRYEQTTSRNDRKRKTRLPVRSSRTCYDISAL